MRAWGLRRTLIAWDSMRRTITATPAGCSIAALLLGLGAFESQAGAVSIRVCAEVEGDANVLWDYSPRPDDRDLGEDWGRLDQRLAVPGMLARARYDEQAVLWGWAPVGDDGCSEAFEAAAGDFIEVEFYYWSSFHGHDASVVSLVCEADKPWACRSVSFADQIFVPEHDADLWTALPRTREAYAQYGAAFAESRSRIWPGITYYTLSGPGKPTVANRAAGGHPTANFGSNAWHSKFTITHEFGHLQTLVAPIPPFSNADVDYCYMDLGCTHSHMVDSQEWQAAAAIEGFADFYSMATWNDLAQSSDAVLAWEATANGWKCRYRPDPASPQPGPAPCTNAGEFPIGAPSWSYAGHCAPNDCPAGVTVQSDWSFALWDIYALEPEVSLADLAALQAMAYPWPVNGLDDDYWTQFISAVTGPVFDADELMTWEDVSHSRGIDH